MERGAEGRGTGVARRDWQVRPISSLTPPRGFPPSLVSSSRLPIFPLITTSDLRISFSSRFFSKVCFGLFNPYTPSAQLSFNTNYFLILPLSSRLFAPPPFFLRIILSFYNSYFMHSALMQERLTNRATARKTLTALFCNAVYSSSHFSAAAPSPPTF